MLYPQPSSTTPSSMSKKNEVNQWKRSSIIDRVVEHVCTPIYQPTNKHWEMIFQALGFTRPTIDSFWTIFYRINKSRSGAISIIEFLNYFNLDRSQYIEKCFQYFDITGDNCIDFLEFIISVWNMCTLKIDTLTNFTFDIYDLNGAGELSLPEIERMVQELYGQDLSLDSTGSAVLKDINHFAEERGGVLSLTSFTIYTANHSLLLLPIFRIQRQIQAKVMGIQYWRNIERFRPDGKNTNHKVIFDARHIQMLLRKYKEGGPEAMLAHCDPDDELLALYTKKEQGDAMGASIPEEPTLKLEKFKFAVDRVKKMNVEQKTKLRSAVMNVGTNALQILWRYRYLQQCPSLSPCSILFLTCTPGQE